MKKKILYEFLLQGKKSENKWVKAKKVHQYLSNFVTFFSFAENFDLTSFLGGPIINFLVILKIYILYEFLRGGKNLKTSG